MQNFWERQDIFECSARNIWIFLVPQIAQTQVIVCELRDDFERYLFPTESKFAERLITTSIIGANKSVSLFGSIWLESYEKNSQTILYTLLVQS